jgi:hypothetical protein
VASRSRRRHARSARAKPSDGARYQFFGRDYQAELPGNALLTSMERKTANIDIRVEPRLVESIDAWRARQRVPPSRTAAIVYMIEQFLKRDPQN